ncbi:pyridoxamine 5'-phosphate oxidase family protein [Kitasatospora sp. NPDC018058]|uniref:pyridoxamine 5'-phosphate oxidase family protein n=1 Tax=Kitasatospora sp. NPDC018058 TaxID=3364025 RepID=UPI0037C15E1F
MEPDRIPTAHAALDEQHCFRLLAGSSVGRVVYTVGALPAVLPVPYRIGGDGSVLLRVAARSELVRAVSGALVAFEAGEIDGTDGTGWSVTVLGRADVSEVSDEEAPSHEEAPADDKTPSGERTPSGREVRVTEVPSAPAVRLSRQVSIRIRPELVTGRLLPDTRP